MLSPMGSLSSLNALALNPFLSNALAAASSYSSIPSTPTFALSSALSAYEGLPIFLVQGAAGLPIVNKGLEMKVNWATQPGSAAAALLGTGGPKIDTSKHFHVFVGDLSPEVDNKALQDAFAPFGEISEAKVIRDLTTLKSKGYGFVAYIRKEDAERAIEQMNGQWLGRRTIRTNWATRRGGIIPGLGTQKLLSFDEVFHQTIPGNCSVYVGGIGQNTTEDDIRRNFSKYGQILEVRVFKAQGYSFVRFDSKDAATNAICNLSGSELNGNIIKCSWGRAQGDPQLQAQAAQMGGGYGYGGGAQGAAAGYGAQGGPGNANNQQYWANQYYNYYNNYNNPAMMQQWQNYWQQGGQ